MYRVLLVDDETLITEGLSILINWKELGFSEIDTASDGEEALAIIKNKSYHLIITDIRMPGLNGLALIKALRVENPSTKIVILSGYSDFSYAREAMQYRVKDYLLKPISKDEITDVVINTINELDEEANNFVISIANKNKLLQDINIDNDIKFDNTLLLSSIEEMDISSIKQQINLLFEEIGTRRFSKNKINGIMYSCFLSLQNLLKKYTSEPIDLLNTRHLLDFMNSYVDITGLSDFFLDIWYSSC